MTQVLDALASQYPQVVFAKANTEETPSSTSENALSNYLGADRIPYIAYLNVFGEKIDSVPGADPLQVVEKLDLHADRHFVAASAKAVSATGSGFANLHVTTPTTIVPSRIPAMPKVDITKAMDNEVSLSKVLETPTTRIKGLINQSQVMLFMKGTPETPKCSSSGKLLDVLKQEKVPFGTFDILSDDDIRHSLKQYSKWPTYPQLYSNGKLIGGLEIVRELHEEGALKDELGYVRALHPGLGA